jgi:hypothetical protein
MQTYILNAGLHYRARVAQDIMGADQEYKIFRVFKLGAQGSPRSDRKCFQGTQ